MVSENVNWIVYIYQEVIMRCDICGSQLVEVMVETTGGFSSVWKCPKCGKERTA